MEALRPIAKQPLQSFDFYERPFIPKYMTRILVIDNYDSFTYNLVSILREIPQTEVIVKRNDVVSEEELLSADAIILSPGPGIPSEAGDLMNLLALAAGRIPVLGVCLGMQAIGEHYGGRLQNLDAVYHGVATLMQVVIPGESLFDGIGEIFPAGRYHSWVIDPDALPDDLLVTAVDEAGHIMAVRHKTQAVYGVQFHPESVLTPNGRLLIENFIRETRSRLQAA